jgi:hypothetical protein
MKADPSLPLATPAVALTEDAYAKLASAKAAAKWAAPRWYSIRR